MKEDKKKNRITLVISVHQTIIKEMIVKYLDKIEKKMLKMTEKKIKRKKAIEFRVYFFSSLLFYFRAHVFIRKLFSL